MDFADLKLTLRTYDTQRSTQRVGIWQLPPPPPGSSRAASKGYWLVFIHGGAWRDPSNTYADLVPAIKHILSSGPLPCSIRGFASVDYRLSPHPNHPQDPSDTPAAELRDARHPDHLEDVCAAVRLLRDEHGVGDGEYVLAGHSAGATLACQLLLRHQQQRVPLPAAVLGVSGIYSLPLLVRTCGPYYEAFVRGAFGGAENWDAASPALLRTGGGDGDDEGAAASARWPRDVLAVLAWSADDTLIPASETDAMAERLRGEDGVDVVVYKGLTGEHDAVWSEGHQLAKAVGITLDALAKR